MRKSVFLCLFFAVPGLLCAQLSGSYTIGGSNPNFATLTAAAAALAGQGISGNVTFQVRPGVYEERIVIGAVPGMNANRRVVFQAENGDSSSVEIRTNTATLGTDYVIGLQNVGQFTFRQLSLRAPQSGNYGTIFAFHNTPNLRLESCRLTSTPDNGLGINIYKTGVVLGGTSPNFVARNCTFAQGQYGINLAGSENFNAQNALLEQNRFVSASKSAITGNYAHNLVFRQNRVDSCAGGMSMFGCSTVVLVQNRLLLAGGAGIQLRECMATAANRHRVANNMIGSLGGTSYAVGIHVQNSRYVDCFFNSLDIRSGDATQTRGIFLSNSSRFVRILNNSVAVMPGARTVQIENEPNEVEAYSHCNLWGGSIVPDLPPFSVSVSPYYVGGSDLHVRNAALDGKATPTTGISTDFDGEPRHLVAPDIGADEFAPSGLSASMVGFLEPHPDSIYCGYVPLRARVQNTGAATLTQFKLTATLNGLDQPPFAWQGNLPAGAFAEVDLGVFPVLENVPNALAVRISEPNGDLDVFPGDDSIFYKNLYTGLSGVYKIGGAGAHFPNFQTAFTALKQGGLCGHVNLQVRDGVYNERLFVEGLRGSSASRVLTLEGESGDSSKAVLSAAATPDFSFTFWLKGCAFLRMRHLTVQQTASPYNVAALFIARGNDIFLENCAILGHAANNSSASDYGLGGFPDSNFTVRNCRIYSGGMGANLVGFGSTKYNLVFEDNDVTGSGDDGVNLQQWRNVRLRNNRIGSGGLFSSFGMYGLQLYNYEISNNRVTVAGPQASEGIYLINCNPGPGAKRLLANNAVSMNLGSSDIAVSRGIWIINCDSIRVLHNTVRHNSQDLDNYACALQQSRGGVLLNNVFVNTGLGMAISTLGSMGLQSDYNVFYTNGTKLSGNATDLAGVQAHTGGDVHSLVGNPNWTNGEPDSLFLKNPALENIGTGTEITSDLRGFPRPASNPDPGAFETPSPPMVVLGADTSVCGPLLIKSQVQGANQIQWNTGETSQNLLVSASGTYILTASNALGSAADTIVVTILPLPTVDAGPDLTLCAGASFVASGEGSGQCTWTDAQGAELSDFCLLPFIAQQSTFFVLTATASNGCQASDTMFLIAKTAPDVPEIKFDGTVLRTDAPGSWQWWLDFLPIAGATAKELTPVAPGNYQVQVTNASGCSRYSDFFDYQPAWPLWFLDADGDGFGTPGSAVFAPQMPSGYAASSSDCNDQNAQISPATPETCNGSDDNCDSLTDNVPPSAVCGSFLTIFLGGGGSFLLAPEQILLSGGDACFPGTETLALDKETFDCSEIGTDFTVTLTLTTLFGETATCQTTVSLEDASPPIAFCAAADTVHLDSSGMLAWPPDNVDAGSFDACGPLNLASSPAFFTLADTGANILTLTATDAAGLSATCTTVLTILPPGTLGAGDFFEKSEAFQIFPNPTSAWLRVLWPQKAGERARCLLVFNALGQKMLEMPLPIGAENAAWLDLRNLESGVYWIGLDSGAGKFILKNGTAE